LTHVAYAQDYYDDSDTVVKFDWILTRSLIRDIAIGTLCCIAEGEVPSRKCSCDFNRRGFRLMVTILHEEQKISMNEVLTPSVLLN